MQALFPGVYAAEMQIPSEALLILIQTQVALDLEDQMAMPHHKTPAAWKYRPCPEVLPPWNLIMSALDQ